MLKPANERPQCKAPSTMQLTDALDRSFGELSALVRIHAANRSHCVAMIDDQTRLTWHEIDSLMDRCAVALQREGVRKGNMVALIGSNSVIYAAIYLAILRIGAVATPLPTSATPASIAAMIEDSGARILFFNTIAADALDAARLSPSIHRICLLYTSDAADE